MANRNNTSKAVTVATIAMTGIVLVAAVVMILYGLKEPVVNILDTRIQIRGMYGVSIDFSEITELSLVEKSMSELGIGIRTNGYGGIGDTLKGNFKSESLGETLLFVCPTSSPTVRISRDSKKDVYISFRDGEKTEQLYRDMMAEIPYE